MLNLKILIQLISGLGVGKSDAVDLTEIFKGKNLNPMSKISAFREELLKHVEIRGLSDGC
jgi:hypothetical protein